MYVAAARETRGETNPQRNNQSSPMRRREEPIEEQNRVNEKRTETRNRRGSRVRESRRGSNQEDGNTRRGCHPTETSGGKGQRRKITKERNLKTENT